MVSVAALWLPIVLSAVIVFVASSIIHMFLKYHQSDYHKLPNEDGVMAALRPANLQPGLYVFPHCTPKDMKTPEAIEKYNKGPVGFMTIMRNGPPVMPKFLAQWFAFLLVVGFFVAYLAAHTIAFGATYPVVFRVVGTAAFLAYGLSNLRDGIWRGISWSAVSKELIDGLLYALLTAGTFGWLWPR